MIDLKKENAVLRGVVYKLLESMGECAYAISDECVMDTHESVRVELSPHGRTYMVTADTRRPIHYKWKPSYTKDPGVSSPALEELTKRLSKPVLKGTYYKEDIKDVPQKEERKTDIVNYNLEVILDEDE